MVKKRASKQHKMEAEEDTPKGAPCCSQAGNLLQRLQSSTKPWEHMSSGQLCADYLSLDVPAKAKPAKAKAPPAALKVSSEGVSRQAHVLPSPAERTGFQPVT